MPGLLARLHVHLWIAISLVSLPSANAGSIMRHQSDKHALMIIDTRGSHKFQRSSQSLELSANVSTEETSVPKDFPGSKAPKYDWDYPVQKHFKKLKDIVKKIEARPSPGKLPTTDGAIDGNHKTWGAPAVEKPGAGKVGRGSGSGKHDGSAHASEMVFHLDGEYFVRAVRLYGHSHSNDGKVFSDNPSWYPNKDWGIHVWVGDTECGSPQTPPGDSKFGSKSDKYSDTPCVDVHQSGKYNGRGKADGSAVNKMLKGNTIKVARAHGDNSCCYSVKIQEIEFFGAKVLEGCSSYPCPTTTTTTPRSTAQIHQPYWLLSVSTLIASFLGNALST